MQILEFPNIGERLICATLANGLRVRIVPKPGFSVRYAAFAANYGGAHRRFTLDGRHVDTPAGVAHYLEHKMFDLPGGDNALNMLSANGADPNAFTSSGMTCYYFQCTEHFYDNLRLLLHFVSTPYFTDETVDKERGIISQEIQMGEDSPDSAVYYSLLGLLYERHPIRDKVAGTVESISHITADTLYDCHRAFYSPANMTLCIEGDVDAERILAIAGEELPERAQSVPQADFGGEETSLPSSGLLETEMSVSAPQFLIGARLRCGLSGEAALRQRLVSSLALRLLAGRSSPFYNALYASGILNRDFDYETDFSAGTGTVFIGGESREYKKVLEELISHSERAGKNGFGAERFMRAKRASFGARLRGLEDFENVCLSMATGVFDGYCAFDAPRILSEIREEECMAFVRENLCAERLAMSVINPKGT